MSWQANVWAVEQEGLTPTEKLVLLILSNRADENGVCWPSKSYLAKHCNVSEATVKRTCRALKDRGLIVVSERRTGDGRQTTNIYRLPIGGGGQSDPPEGVADEPPEGVTHDPQDVQKKRSKEEEAISRIFDAWKTTMKHPRAKLVKARRSRIRARLREGYTADELIAAIKGARQDPWLMGKDRRSPRKYDDLDTILRDGIQVERLSALVMNGDRPQRPKRGREEWIEHYLALGDVSREEAEEMADHQLARG